ncbi:hypothetical protein CAEBREN_32613 [Caenorhabditis brenneri]|uniref:7TM GPCR serpentine receptor class x (Srx) domain-containing protein n=1 Tax=Caenorhabditis brenneri TaxID=135651 RepID=G0MPE8_CAEBE|nr:hypothetical protein CAEBREN_32613 [Caenorhabditis brenneri]
MTTGDLFSNCSDHYLIESYFINCTNTTRPCELIHDFALVARLLTILDFYVSSVLFLFAGVINVYFLWICLPMYWKINSETKKRYVFVINRCIASISAAITLLILRCVLYVYFPPETSSYYLYAVVIISNDIAFYSLQGEFSSF